MKKLLIAIFFIGGVFINSNTAKAQSNWEAGIRFGDVVSADITIPFKAPRIHAAAYFNNNNFGIGGYFDWLFVLDDGPVGLKFYPGVGPELYFGNNIDLAVAGDFGAEYSFDFPLTIALDWRPRIELTNNANFYGGNWGLIARFRFDEGVSFSRAN